MLFKAGIVALLEADTTLSGLIGSRLYPVIVPPDSTTYPCLTYQIVTASSEFGLDVTRTNSRRVQFSAISNTSYADCTAILDAVGNVLDGFRGVLGNGVRIISSVSATEIDNFENDSRTYRSICDYEIEYVNPNS